MIAYAPCATRSAVRTFRSKGSALARAAVLHLDRFGQQYWRHFAGRSSEGDQNPSGASTDDPSTIRRDAHAGPKSPSPALFVLPLLKRPAFPGFYQTLQVSDQAVLDFLLALRKTGQAQFLGGFMTKEPKRPTGEDEESDSYLFPASDLGSAPFTAQVIWRDTCRINNVSEVEQVGTLLQVINVTQHPKIPGGQIVVMPHRRIRQTRVVSAPSPNVALGAVAVQYLEELQFDPRDTEVKALHADITEHMNQLLAISAPHKEQFDQVVRFYDVDDPIKLADLVAGLSMVDRGTLQDILNESDVINRMTKVLSTIKLDLDLVQVQGRMKDSIEGKVSKEQRRRLLMDYMHQVQKELGIDKDDKHTLISRFRDAVSEKTLTTEASSVLENELAKLLRLDPSSSEFNICQTYLGWITSLPWGICSEENQDITKAESILNEDHYGLEEVKERILEHMAVSFLKGSTQGKIMCLTGPPGVGKTSIGESIARALNRKLYRFSVGGMHDVAEIRGHRRTYVGAMPGKLIHGLKLTQTANPVVLIDEIDKLGRDFRGDPSSALLEILDPEQNSTFRDHYLDVPVDLSQVLFVCTANVTDTIPGPLLDRMEVISIAGYVFEEKVEIANKFLIPQTEAQSGIGGEIMKIEKEALDKIIADYAREAGVRHLRKLFEKINRKVALAIVRNEDGEKTKTIIGLDNLVQYIGQPPHQSGRLYKAGMPPGVVTGLAWTQLGGATLLVEAISHQRVAGRHHGVEFVTDLEAKGEEENSDKNSRHPQKQDQGPNVSLVCNMRVTGHVGGVMSESSSISLSYARLFLRELGEASNFFESRDIHLNVLEGAVPKDGPSAGITMTTALLSLALNVPVKPDIAMTGELMLSGKVLKVGGIKEKVISARREGILEIIMPRCNEAEYTELKEHLRAGILAHFVDYYDDVYALAFDAASVPALGMKPRGVLLRTVEPPVQAAMEPAPSEPGVQTID